MMHVDFGGNSNLPPGCHTYHDEGEVQQVCKNLHGWLAPMFWELGGSLYRDDDQAYCPLCSEPDIHNDRDRSLLKWAIGYYFQEHHFYLEMVMEGGY